MDSTQNGERVVSQKHPYGRIASIRHGALQAASGLVTVLTLGEVQPRWVLDNAFRTALGSHRKSTDNGGPT